VPFTDFDEERYIARRVWRLLEHPPVLEITA
jgi:hypothetical protein